MHSMLWARTMRATIMKKAMVSVMVQHHHHRQKQVKAGLVFLGTKLLVFLSPFLEVLLTIGCWIIMLNKKSPRYLITQNGSPLSVFSTVIWAWFNHATFWRRSWMRTVWGTSRHSLTLTWQKIQFRVPISLFSFLYVESMLTFYKIKTKRRLLFLQLQLSQRTLNASWLFFLFDPGAILNAIWSSQHCEHISLICMWHEPCKIQQYSTGTQFEWPFTGTTATLRCHIPSARSTVSLVPPMSLNRELATGKASCQSNSCRCGLHARYKQ